MRLLFKILLSCLLAISVLKGLDYVVTYGLQHDKDFKIAYITRHKVGADLVIHGPCEAEWTVDPTVLEADLPYSCFNLAQNHSDFADNYLFLKTYLQHQPLPKAILLYVTPESFDSSVANTFNTYRYSFLLGDSTVKKTVAEMDPSYYKVSWLPFIRYSYYSNFIFYKAIDGYVHLITNNTSPKWPTGYTPPANSFNHEIERFSDLNPKKGYFGWSPSRDKYFLKLIQLLKSQQIPLMVYESPVYYEALAYQANRKERIMKIDSICSSQGIPYFRFDTLAMQYDRKNYFSTYNTTMAGNEIFNPFLGKFLKDTLPAIIK